MVQFFLTFLEGRPPELDPVPDSVSYARLASFCIVSAVLAVLVPVWESTGSAASAGDPEGEVRVLMIPSSPADETSAVYKLTCSNRTPYRRNLASTHDWKKLD
eukprot:SAG11_NODE_23185_length_393_cov_2.061224_1_plen_102_part_10